MKPQIMKYSHKFFIYTFLLMSSWLLSACASATMESVPTSKEGQQTEIILPLVESDNGNASESVIETEAYPDPELETQNLDKDIVSANQAYPEPDSEVQSQAGEESIQQEDDTVKQVEPTQEPKPTPRGNELVASNPSTVNLSSGNIQLVELFAFW